MDKHFFDGWPVQDRISLAVQVGAFVIVGIATAVVQCQDNDTRVTPTIAHAATIEVGEVENPEHEDEQTPATTSITTLESLKALESISTTIPYLTTNQIQESTSEETTAETSISETTAVASVTEVSKKAESKEIKPQINEVPQAVNITTHASYVQETTNSTVTTLIVNLQTETEITSISTNSTVVVIPGVATTLEEVDNCKDLDSLVGSVYTVTKSEYILLCNLLGREYGANWVTEAEKAKVIECVMNRVYSKDFPNTVRGVLGQRNQFTGALKLGDSKYTRKVTQSVKTAVLNYLNGAYKNHGYRFYYGDGRRNHFRINY